MAYQLTSSDCILRLADNAFIPPDPANRDYKEYLAWLAEGNTPDPAPEPPAQTELTAEEKLAASGLTLDDFVEVIENVLSG
jgi:hypothetical protein